MTDGLVLASDLGPLGSEAALRAGVKRGELVRIRQGAYADAAMWGLAPPEERMRIRARAFVAACRSTPVLAYTTAAALWRLPGFRVADDVVHTIEEGPRPSRSRADVVRHCGLLPLHDVAEVDRFLVTSLERTVVDVIRTVPLEAAVSYFDAALRRVAWRSPGRYDDAAAERFRGDVVARLDAMGAARGIRQGRFVAEFADGRAQLPGESVSRLWMHRLGVPAPVLQLEVVLPDGRRAFLDFAWPRLRKFGEFDGEGKYLDPAMSAGRSVREILRDQRARESAITAVTAWTAVRWGSEKLAGIEAFEKFLRSQRLLA